MSHRAVTARLLIDPPGAGAWNMAVDQALLESVAETGGLVLRFYQWAEPTLSLGYFQRLADRVEHRTSQQVAMVRRASGGGAILHDRELTYSLSLPDDFSPGGGATARSAAWLYRTAHESLIEALADQGVIAELCDSTAHGGGREPFLCFARRAAGDVLLAGFKVAGSAQRRCGKSVLQHGSVLLSASSAAPELAGIAQLASTDISPPDMIGRWLPRLTRRLGIASRPSHLTAAEFARAEHLRTARYGTPAWTGRR